MLWTCVTGYLYGVTPLFTVIQERLQLSHRGITLLVKAAHDVGVVCCRLAITLCLGAPHICRPPTAPRELNHTIRQKPEHGYVTIAGAIVVCDAILAAKD